MIWVDTLAAKLRRLHLVLISGAGKRWPGIIASAEARGIEGVTPDFLMRLHQHDPAADVTR